MRRSLGLLALATLLATGMSREPDADLDDLLARAVAAYGDGGLDVLRRVYRARKDPRVFQALQRVGTPAAVRVADELYDRKDPESRSHLLCVKVAAGEPFWQQALLAALDDASVSVQVHAIKSLDRLFESDSIPYGSPR